MYRQSDHGLGFGGGAIASPIADGLFERTPTISTRRAALADFAPDLARAFGSAVWWRGLTSCAALLAATWLLSPGYVSLPGNSSRPFGLEDARDVRALAITPLAFGGDSGRQFVATDAVQPLTDVPERATVDITTMVAQGDGLARALQRAGVGGGEAAQIVAMTSSVTDPGAIAPGTTLQLTLGRRAVRTMPRPIDRLAFRARFDMNVTFERGPGGLRMERTSIGVDATPLRVGGVAEQGIFLAATAAGAPAQAVQTFIRAIAARVSIDGIDPQARYDMIVERQRADTGEVRFGKLLYVGLSQASGDTRMIEWTIDGRTDWFDASGVAAVRTGFTAPVVGHRTSGFGLRFHPLLGYTRMHQGIDYGAVYGAPIRAVTDGTVAFAGWHGGHGNMVRLAHGGGLGSGYAHMSRIAVAAGERVAQGQVIGFVGSTGLSTGPHLHFEVYRGGQAIDPSGVSFASQPLLSGAALAAFHARLAAITGRTAGP